jgi:hypothetical protein
MDYGKARKNLDNIESQGILNVNPSTFEAKGSLVSRPFPVGII